jgi:hypothetical protein
MDCNELHCHKQYCTDCKTQDAGLPLRRDLGLMEQALCRVIAFPGHLIAPPT